MCAAVVWTHEKLRRAPVDLRRYAAAVAAVGHVEREVCGAPGGRRRRGTALHDEIRGICCMLLYTCDGHCGVGHPDVTVLNCQIAPGVPLTAADRAVLATCIKANTVVKSYMFHHMNLCSADLEALTPALVSNVVVAQLNFGEFTLMPQTAEESETTLLCFGRIVAEMRNLQQIYVDQHMSRALKQQGIDIGAEMQARADGGMLRRGCLLMSHSGRGCKI